MELRPPVTVVSLERFDAGGVLRLGGVGGDGVIGGDVHQTNLDVDMTLVDDGGVVRVVLMVAATVNDGDTSVIVGFIVVGGGFGETKQGVRVGIGHVE